MSRYIASVLPLSFLPLSEASRAARVEDEREERIVVVAAVRLRARRQRQRAAVSHWLAGWLADAAQSAPRALGISDLMSSSSLFDTA